MNKGFFQSSELASVAAESRIASCGLCGLYKHCKSPKMKPTGKNKKNILIVAEAPGEQEDKFNTQLIGKSGKRLRRTLKSLRIDLDRDCIKTNAVICRREENETPTDAMIFACRPNLIKTIKKYEPNVIILLGAVAVKSLLGILYKEDVGAISRWGGYCIPNHNPNAWIVPTFHPSYIMRKDDKVLNRIFKQHLKMAVKKAKSKPFKQIPDYKNDVEIVLNSRETISILKCIRDNKNTIAFDYECNCLKPDGEGPEIICCSVCYKNKYAIAFPWQNDVAEEMSTLLKSKIPKIGANIKFEDRWTRSILGHRVRNWYWDTMLAAHVLDNRPSVTSLTFQAFTQLGVKPYDEHIKPFLGSTKKKRFNRIKELNLKELLLYNGLDSLFTFLIAKRQIKQFENIK